MKWIPLPLGVPIILLAAITSANPMVSVIPNPRAQQQAASETFFGTVLKNGSDFVLSDAGTKTRYLLDSAQKVSRYEGTWVKVIGTLDADNKLIHVETIQPINTHIGG
jgi:hypothetical protein